MRGKLAKALRRQAREAAAAQGLPERSYLGFTHTAERYTPAIQTPGTLVDGKWKRPTYTKGKLIKVQSTQLVNDPKSERGIYLALKGSRLLQQYVNA